jgi:hypothetical protein
MRVGLISRSIARVATLQVGIFWLAKLPPAKRGYSLQAARWSKPSRLALASLTTRQLRVWPGGGMKRGRT